MGGSSDDGTGFGEDLDVSSSSFDSEFEITEGEERCTRTRARLCYARS